VGHAVDALLKRLLGDYDEFRQHGAGVPIRVVPGEQGIIAVCGDRENIDRRGRLAVTWVGPDDLLVLLGIEDADDVPADFSGYQEDGPPEARPYVVFFKGEGRVFQAARKPFLLGVCECDRGVVLVGNVDGGLAIMVRSAKAWDGVLVRDWQRPIDLDVVLEPDAEVAPEPAPGAGDKEKPTRPSRPSPVEPSGAARLRSQDPTSEQAEAEARSGADELRRHYTRIARGITPGADPFTFMDIYMGQMARDAMMPNRQIKRPRMVRAHIEPATAGLLKFLRAGGGNLGGREKDILDALKVIGVVLPRGALSCVFQCYRALGCPFLSQPDPKEGKECSREWQFDGGDALDPENPKHLAMLKATRTMRAISELRKPIPLEDAPAAQELPAAGMAGAGATEQPTSATGAPSS